MSDVFHLGLKKADLQGATLAIVPGDPERVKRIAELLDNPVHLASHREFTTWRGEMDGKAVIICSTGIGGPSTSIAVEELAQLPLEERVWRRLQLVARGYGSRDAPRRRIRLSQELLAQMLGVSRQSINKALKALEAGGRLRLHYGEIELPAPSENPGSPAPAGPAAG